VPSPDNIEALKLANRRPDPPKDPLKELAVQNHKPFITKEAVLDDLPLDSSQRNEWLQLMDALVTDNDIVSRQKMYDLFQQQELDSILRNVMQQRIMQFRQNNAMTKAQAKGGKYYKRVQTQKGGYRYYYDQDTYNRSKDAHVDGSEAANSAIKGFIEKAFDSPDKKKSGFDIKNLKSLVKRYGSDKVGEVLKAACDAGEYTFTKDTLFKKDTKETSDV
jgi:hypothetical protein